MVVNCKDNAGHFLEICKAEEARQRKVKIYIQHMQGFKTKAFNAKVKQLSSLTFDLVHFDR